MKAFKSILQSVKQHAIPLLCALVMNFFVMCGDNQPYSLGNEKEMLKRLHIVERIFQSTNDSIPEDYFLINIGYDRMLVEKTDELGIPQGEIDITHRKRLLDFLQILTQADTSIFNKTSSYKYKGILLDVNFHSQHISEYDSALYKLFNTTPRLLISSSPEINLPDDIDKSIIATSLYHTSSKEGDFVKYPFYDKEGEPMIALKYYTDILGGHDLDSWRDMHCMTMRLPLLQPNDYNKNGEKTYYNLGVDILDTYTAEEILELTHNKNIIIGDFSNIDLHNTYTGMMSGPMIIINAIETLRHGRQQISWWSLIISTIAYTIACSLAIKGYNRRKVVSFFKILPRKIRSFIVSFIGYSLVLIILTLITWIIFGQFHDIFFPTIFITTVFFISHHKKDILKYYHKTVKLLTRKSS